MYNVTIRLAFLCAICIAFCAKAFAQQPAFPTAEGAGKFTSGGRGTVGTPTRVFEVTNLNDDNNPGSLRYALSQAATYRTVVFRVSGTIHLASKLNIPANTTIAGQTAPGDGICIADHEVSVNGNNVIVRFIRFRLGDRYQNLGMVDGSGNEDALNGIGRANVIIDHCTMSWSDDEAFSFYDGANVTLQWNIISEPLNYSYHFEAGDTDFEHHGYGGIQGGNNVSIHHNLFAHCQNRTPRLNGSRYGVRDSVDFRNNVIYNWGANNVYGGEGGAYNVVNNYYKYGPSTSSSARFRILNPYKQTTAPVLPYGRFYLTGNYVDGSVTNTDNNWTGVLMNGGTANDTAQSKMTVPFPFEALNTQSAVGAFQSVMNNAGAVLPKRDTLDQRVISDVLNRTGRIIDVQGGYPHGTPYASTVNAWPTLNASTPPADNDHDGMPDDWETRRGLNPADAADRGLFNANGYTNLENYLNGDSAVATGIVNTCVNTKTVYSSNSGVWLQAKDTTYALANATDSTNLVASILDNAAMGVFNVSYYTTNSIRTYNGTAMFGRNVTIVPASPGSVAAPATVRLYFTKKEFGGNVNTVRIWRTADNNCPTGISAAPAEIVPVATGTFGTYADGYYVEFTTTDFGTFFFYSVNTAPTINQGGTLSAFSQTVGTPSAVQTYTVSASNLSDNLTVTPPANYEVSADGGTTWYSSASPLVLAPSSGVVPTTTVTVRLNATTAGTYAGNIVHASNGATSVAVPVNGTTVPVYPSAVLQWFPFTTGSADSAGARSPGVAASAATLNNLALSNGTTVAPYSTNFGQAIAATADGFWTTAVGGPGGNLNRRNYEQITVTAGSSPVRVDSLLFSAAYISTQSNTRMAVVYSKNGFTAPADSTEFTGGYGYNPSTTSFGSLILSANNGFANAFGLPQQNSGPLTPVNYQYRLALAGTTGVTVAAGQTLTIRLYFSCGSTSSGRFLTMRDLVVKGAVLSSAPLPLRLLSFSAAQANGKTLLNWQTTAETNVNRYEVQRSANGNSFSTSGSVTAKGAVVNDYSFTDPAAINGNVYYRLKMIDNDGSFAYSPVVLLKAGSAGLLTVYPNPVRSALTLLHPPAGATSEVLVYTAGGGLLKRVKVAEGERQTVIPVQNLAAGAYRLVYRSNDAVETTGFLKME